MPTSGGIPYPVVAAGLLPAWLLAMTLAGAYDRRFIAYGTELYRRVLNGGVWLLAIIAFFSFALRAELSREFILLSIPSAALLTLTGRYAVRKSMHHSFARGAAAHKVLAIGPSAAVCDLVAHMNRA